MDLTRSLLIGTIAVLSFMLLTEWVAFKEARLPEPLAPAAAITNGNPADPASDLPDPSFAAPSNTTIPAAGEIPSVDTPTAKSATPAASRSITVNTDVLRVRIDLNGGDITEVALSDYPARLDNPAIPFLLLEDNQRRTYVAQSGLIGRDGIDTASRARYRSSKTEHDLDSEQTLTVDLVAEAGTEVRITKRFIFTRGDYLIRVEYLIDNQSDARWQANMFGQIKRDASEDPSSELASGMGMVPFLGSATTLPDERFAKFDFEDMAEKPLKEKISGGWIAMIQHYFLSAWIPNPALTHSYSTRVTPAGFNIAGFVSPATVVDPGASASVGADFYAGPKDQYRLAEISEYLDLSVDYGWLWWIAQPLFWLLIKIYSFVGNWGVAIILLTVLIKAAFFQLSATSYRSMAKMRNVGPKIQAIRERYPDDKQKQSQEMMTLYRKEKINPLSGCLPILVQMPVFIALYWVLMESVELRQAPFFGWIDDLSVMDPYFILPLIMGASMWFQQKLAPPPPDPMQAKLMQWMPIVFTFFFLWFPAGLVLYWVTNNLLSIAQQWFITRQIEKAAAAA
ncbi:MAG: membrane protein insertase YidC [Halieaceae bacterium]|jgi:YidC/Oxa1 family membrane protein insertase|nr:membrane protein insertase YidC [Halieaceae bacterium]